ncbi:MAG: YlxR family protein [Oscillospiraceae bacterium]|nr:YlxR family protein [Oscillospiraceae bacterium]
MKAEARWIPERMCVGCRQKGSKDSFIRIVSNKSGEVLLDFAENGKSLSGRGAYIHKSPACLKTAVKKKSLERNLKCKIPEEIYELLETEINGVV